MSGSAELEIVDGEKSGDERRKNNARRHAIAKKRYPMEMSKQNASGQECCGPRRCAIHPRAGNPLVPSLTAAVSAQSAEAGAGAAIELEEDAMTEAAESERTRQ